MAVAKLRAEGFMPANQVNLEMVGQTVQIEVGSADKRELHPGVLRFVSPEIDPVTKQVRVWAEVPNSAGQLLPGEQGVLKVLPE